MRRETDRENYPISSSDLLRLPVLYNVADIWLHIPPPQIRDCLPSHRLHIYLRNVFIQYRTSPSFFSSIPAQIGIPLSFCHFSPYACISISIYSFQNIFFGIFLTKFHTKVNNTFYFFVVEFLKLLFDERSLCHLFFYQWLKNIYLRLYKS